MECSLFSPSLDLRLCPSLDPSTLHPFSLTNRWSMIIGGAAYALVVASNFSSDSIIQICANLLVGVGAAMLWNAEGVYLGRCALWDSRTSTKSFAETTSAFNGVFYSIFQFSGCAGTLIGGLIRQFFSDKPNVCRRFSSWILPLFYLILPYQ